MDEVKIIELKESILEDNSADANVLRQELKSKKICLMNLMSSPRLRQDYNLACP